MSRWSWWVLIVVCACGGSHPATQTDAGTDAAPPDGSPPTEAELVGVSPPLANAGSTVILEGTFSDQGLVHLPGGGTAPISVLGPHRAAMVVPMNTTLGDLHLSSGSTDTGRVSFHAVTFQLGLQQFESDENAGVGREPGLLAASLYGHGTVTLGDSIYVLGGHSGGNAFVADVEHATINADGSLGAFSISPDVSLATPRADFSTAVVGNYVYVLGGQDGTSLTSVERATINADDTLGTFSTVPGVALTMARVQATVAVVGDYLYVIGGAGAADTVERATIAADGTIGTFELVSGVTLAPDPATMKGGRAGAASVVLGDQLYVFGGNPEQPAAPELDVQVASIAADGSISPFVVLPDVTLPSGRVGLATMILGDGLYTVGGGLDYSADDTELLRAPIQADGTLGSFVQTGLFLPETRIEPTVAVAGNTFYVLGGEPGPGTSGNPNVARTTIDADGALGTSSAASATLDAATYDHAMITSGNHVYVLGGVDGSGAYSSAVHVATVDQGLLGSFATSSGVALATARAGFATAVVGGYVYVIGGNTSAGAVGTLERAPIASDGTLGAFESYADASLVVPRAHASAVVVAGYGSTRYLLVIGGIGADGSIRGDVEYSTIGADGSLSPFAIDADATLQTPRYQASTFVHREDDGYYVYVVGGIGSSGYLDDVERGGVHTGAGFPANFAGFGHVSGVTLATPRAGAAAEIIGNTLYVLGGIGTAGPIDSVEAAAFSHDPINPLAAFSTVSGVTLATPRGGASCVVIANQLYTVGGLGAAGALDSVEVAPLQ